MLSEALEKLLSVASTGLSVDDHQAAVADIVAQAKALEDRVTALDGGKSAPAQS